MTNGVAMRRSLDQFSKEEILVDELVERHPDCACEYASSPTGGAGPVTNGERLRYFIFSRSQFDAKYPGKRKSAFGPARLTRIFDKGLSTVRLDVTSPGEMELTASIIHKAAINNDAEFGGAIAVADFSCQEVRSIMHDKQRALCIVETPLEAGESPFSRPSHADIIHSGCSIDVGDRIGIVTNLFNTMVRTSYTPAKAVADCDLSPFLPKSTNAA